jgi:hypothetical protein
MAADVDLRSAVRHAADAAIRPSRGGSPHELFRQGQRRRARRRSLAAGGTLAAVAAATFVTLGLPPIPGGTDTPRPARTGNAAPELGTAVLPPEIRRQMEQTLTRTADTPVTVDGQGHLLARWPATGPAELTLVGNADTSRGDCYAVLAASPTLALGCSGASPPDPRSISAARDTLRNPAGGALEAISGAAPAGTAEILLTAGARSQRVPAYDAGSARSSRAFYIAPWPDSADTRVTALDSNGQELAVLDSSGG